MVTVILVDLIILYKLHFKFFEVWQRKFQWYTDIICWCLTVAGPVEADPEYQLIVEANNITVEIDNEISETLFVIV